MMCTHSNEDLHDHENEHHLDHHHEHHLDHHHEAAENAVEGMFVLSSAKHFDGPIEVETLQDSIRTLFYSLAKKASLDGFIPGHLKGVVKASNGATLGVSVTRPDTVDFVPSAAWEQLKVLDQYEITVNVMLLAETDIHEQDLFVGLTQSGNN